MQETRDSINDIWGERMPYVGNWPIRIDQAVEEDPDHWVQSSCVLCSNGCGIDIGVKNGRIVGVRGRGQDRVNHGRLGPKGLHGWVANHSKDRLLAPLIKWQTAEEAFEAWKICSKGRPCDYSGLSYAKLSEGSGIQWPCNEQYPNGAEHIYTDGKFNTSSDYCEDFGHDLTTGADVSPEAYKARDTNDKAFLKAADYEPPHEQPDKEYPFWLTTGRVVYHFHTRTKTARSADLNNAAPDAFVQISEEDATKKGIREGDMIEVTSRRGKMAAPAMVGGILPGLLFIPFHYGYWDDDKRLRAANELTLTEWDPVSKQPHYKYAAVNIKKKVPGKADKMSYDLKNELAETAKGTVEKVKQKLKL